MRAAIAGLSFFIVFLVGCTTAPVDTPNKKLATAEITFIALVTAICDALPGAYGVLNVQLMHDEATGRSTVIEINPRFGGGFPLTDASGGGFVAWLLEERYGLASTMGSTTWRDGLVMLRYDDAVFVDADEAGLT